MDIYLWVRRLRQKIFWKALSACALLLILGQVCWGMSSANYQIKQDSINFGGADQSVSDNYILDDTMGEVGTGFVYSANYWAGVGYRQMLVAEPSISFSLSKNTINLGALSTGSVSSDSHIFTVTTNAISGYAVKLYEDGNLRSGANDIDDVGDGAVTAGSEEYGVRTSGTDGQSNSTDTAISNGLILANSSVPVDSRATTVTYKASIDGSTAGGSYQHAVYFIVAGTF